MYQEKIEGQVCQDCGQANYVKNPRTGKVFCANKCWLTGSETQQNAPQQVFNQNQAQGTESGQNIPQGQFLTLNQFNEQIDKMRGAFRTMQAEIDALQKKVGSHATLLIDVKGQDAVDLHEALEPEKDEFSVDQWSTEASDKLSL